MIIIQLTEEEAKILYEAVATRFCLEDFDTTNETDCLLHKVDAAFQQARAKSEGKP